jgi:hypothetical protein
MSDGAYSLPARRGSSELADLLERVLDKGVVIAGDIRVDIADVELLSIKLRLLVASVDTAKKMGIDWWERDPFLSGRPDDQPDRTRTLEERLERLESLLERSLEDPDRSSPSVEPTRSAQDG